MNRTTLRVLTAAGTLWLWSAAPGQEPSTDPYLWLEEIESPKALDWAKARNEKSLARITKDPRYPGIEAEVRKIVLASDRLPVPVYQGGFIYNFWQDGRHVRGIWRRTRLASYGTASPEWELVLDLDALAAREKENWVWHGAQCLPPEHQQCLVSLSRGGKDADVVREFDAKAKEFVPAARGGFEVPEAKSAVAWMDRDTLLVGTDFGPGTMTKSGYPSTVRRWKRRTPLSAAEQIFSSAESDVGAFASTQFRKEGKYVGLHRMKTFFTGSLSILHPGGRIDRVAIPEDADLRTVYQGRVLFLLRTDWKGLRAGSLVAVRLEDFANPKPELVYAPTERSSVGGIEPTVDGLYVGVLDNVRGRVYRATLEGPDWKLRRISLPDNGTVRIVTADPFAKEILFSYENFLTPATIYVLPDGGTGLEPRTLKQLPERFNAKGMMVEQFECRSSDGTLIPYFVIRKHNVRPDGTNPTLLYGYGGFENPLLPQYLNWTGKVWLERGGIYVSANIRGGGEFGPKWHSAVLKENRPKVFEDFIGVAEDLVRRRLTSPAHLGIAGGSNGGLLVGASFVRRPDLFRAVFCAVPLLDMLRYTRLSAGDSWTAEYGRPDDPKEGQVLRSYSPYHNVRSGVRYPRVFFYTSTKDDRVHPGHARKMVARMEEQGHEVLYYENMEGGHGGSANLEQRIRQLSMEYMYLLQELQGAGTGTRPTK